MFRDLYFRLLLWLENWKADREDQVVEMPRFSITRTTTQEAYYFGIKQIKEKVNQLTKAKTKEEYEKALSELTSLEEFAIKNNSPDYLKFIENLKKVYVYKKEEPLKQIVDRRIKACYELQNHIEKRRKLREQRKNNGKSN